MNGRLKDRVAIITGAGRGIGQAVARRFASEGAAVSLADLNKDGTAETARMVTEQGGQALSIRCDVGDRSAVNAMVKQTFERFGRIDILINNAQIIPAPTPAEEFSVDQWDPVDASGTRGTLFCCQAVFPHMRESGGSIVNFSSAAGIVGAPWLLPYAAAKGAIIAMSYTLAQEWGRFGIRVNTIAPAANTPATAEWGERVAARVAKTGAAPPSGVATSAARLPVLAGAGLDPAIGIAPVVAFLASDDSIHMTGQTLCVDGGVVMH